MPPKRAAEDAVEEIETEGAAAAAAAATQDSVWSSVQRELFAPEVRWGNASVAGQAVVFAGAVFVLQTYGYLLAQ